MKLPGGDGRELTKEEGERLMAEFRAAMPRYASAMQDLGDVLTFIPAGKVKEALIMAISNAIGAFGAELDSRMCKDCQEKLNAALPTHKHSN